jgi:hypothetical protein
MKEIDSQEWQPDFAIDALRLPAGIAIQTGPSFPIVDLRGQRGAEGAPAFDMLIPQDAEPIPEDLRQMVGEWLAIHAEGLADEEREPATAAEEVEIVDVAQLEAEKAARRRASKREAQRRWRKNHPEKHREQVRAWKEKPANRARAAEYARTYRQRQKIEQADDGPSPVDSIGVGE